MKDTNRQHIESSDSHKDVAQHIHQSEKDFFDEEEVRITDLETPDPTRYQRTTRLTELMMKSITTSWIRYSLIGLLILVLLFTLLQQFHLPAFPGRGQNVLSIPTPTTTAAFYPLTPLVANGRVFIQSENNTLNTFQVTNGHLLWQKPLPAPAQLATTGQLLFCYYVKYPGQSVLAAFDIETGQLAWQHLLSTSLPVSRGEGPGFLLDGDQLYTVDEIGMLRAFQAGDGHVLWSSQAGPAVQKLSLNNAIYAGNGVVEINSPDDHSVIIRAARDGHQITRLAARRYGLPLPIAVDNQFIYVLPSSDYQSIGQNIQVLRASDGVYIWGRAFPQGIGLVQEMDGVIYLSNIDHSSLSALRGSDGHQLWSYQPDDGEAITSFYFSPRGTIYLLQQNAVLVSLRASDGQVLWRDQSVPVPHNVVGNPQILVDGDVLFLYNNFTLSDTQNIPIAAFRTGNGHLLWQGLTSPGKPLPQAGILYLLLGQEIDAWNETTGAFLWSYQSPSILSLVGNVPNIVLFIDQTGRLGAFRTTDGKPLWFYP